MKKIIIMVLWSVFFVIFTISSALWAYDNEITHRDITEYAVMKSAVKSYLTDNLELSNGYETKLNGKKIMNWLMDGSEKEDKPMCRATNHFHDPLRYNDDPTIKWWMSGLSKNIFFTEWYCVFTGWPGDETVSAVTWAAA